MEAEKKPPEDMTEVILKDTPIELKTTGSGCSC
jgi:hypothetical protein